MTFVEFVILMAVCIPAAALIVLGTIVIARR